MNFCTADQFSGFRYSRGISKYDNAPTQRMAADFDSFTKAVLGDRSPRKGMAYICSPLSYGPHDDMTRYPNDNHFRLASHAEPRSFLPLDFDGFSTPDAYQSTLAFLEPYLGFSYTTASHTRESPRARAVIALTRNVARAEGIIVGEVFQRVMQNALGEDAIKFDPSVYRAEQPCYTPITTSETYRFVGAPIDVDALLNDYGSTGSITAVQISNWTVPAYMQGAAGNLGAGRIPETPEARARLYAALSYLSPDCGRNEWRNIVWSILAHGWPCCVDIAREWSKRSAKYDEADFNNVVRDFKP